MFKVHCLSAIDRLTHRLSEEQRVVARQSLRFMVIGYTILSRTGLKGYGRRDNARRTAFRFFVVSPVSLGLNALWTWLFATKLGFEKHVPLIPIPFVTPIATFTLNRKWVFA